MYRNTGIQRSRLALVFVLCALVGIGLSTASAEPTLQITYPQKEQVCPAGISRAEGTAGPEIGSTLAGVYVMLYYYNNVGTAIFHYWNWTTQAWQLGSGGGAMIKADGLESWKLESGFPTTWEQVPDRTYALYARVVDASGSRVADVNYFYVEPDNTLPSIDLNILQPTLSPANHKLVLAAEVTVSDDCDPAPQVVIRVASSEPEPSGKKQPKLDWEVVQRDGVWEIWLRAERDKKRVPRVYRLGVWASDSSGNQASETGTVTVP